MAKKISRFWVIVGLPPGPQRDWPNGFNFYFKVQDQADPTQWGLYLFGSVADTPRDIPLPENWSASGVTTTPRPLSVDEWSGSGIYHEEDGRIREDKSGFSTKVTIDPAISTNMWIQPKAIEGLTINVPIPVSIQKPQTGGASTTSMVYPFMLRAVSPDVASPGITAARRRLRRQFTPRILLPPDEQ